MADKKMTLQRKMDLLNRMIMRPSTVRFILSLLEKDKTWKELMQERAKPADKITYFLAIVDKYLDDNHIMYYTLTPKGKRLADSLQNLFDILDDVLPEGK